MTDHAQIMRIGLISDTHGLLRPEAIKALSGCNHIIHCGDIGGIDIITQLSALAPVSAVRGNTDGRRWASEFKEAELIELGEIFIYILHDLASIDLNPEAAGVQVVASGHTHEPLIKKQGSVIYINPGSAGPKRPNLPISVAELMVVDRLISAKIIELTVND